MKITVLMGVIGSGKGFLADQLISKGSVKVDFADAVREDVWKMLKWSPRNELEYEEFKTATVSFQVANRAYTLNGRDILNTYGTDIRRKEDEQVWVKRALTKIRELHKFGRNVVISDCRFPNEVGGLLDFEVSTGVDIDFVFCDFKSHKYDDKSTLKSEAFTQFLKSTYNLEDKDPRFNDIIRMLF